MKVHQVLGGVGTALVLLLASVWIPVVGSFLSLLTPLPFLSYSTRLGVSQAVKLTRTSILGDGLIAAGFSLFLFFSPLRWVPVNALVVTPSSWAQKGFPWGQKLALGRRDS